MGSYSNSLLEIMTPCDESYCFWDFPMAQLDPHETEKQDCSTWSEAVAENAPALMPEKLPPEFSPAPFPVTVKRKRRRVELPKFKQSSPRK